jgi:hypothetical protein
MKRFLCQSGSHMVIVDAADADRAREICAVAEIEMLGLGRKLGEDATAENLPEFVQGWYATELAVPEGEGVQMAWWRL